ncbi:MAG: hypothetical protein MJ172_08305 [Clostridia bacterium]|nr:hypothetical protein [Clostridia bacterium]
MSFAYSYIDYNDMIAELKEDLEQGIISEESSVYIIRQNTPVTLSSSSEVFYPVLDYLYMEPELKTSLVPLTIAEAKRAFYALNDEFRADSCKLNLKDTYLQILAEILKSLGDYTHGRSKRNDETISVVYTLKDNIPFAFFFDDDDASDELEAVNVKELMQELLSCNQN